MKIKINGNFETTNMQLSVQVILASRAQATIEKLVTRLRADSIKKHTGANYLGEVSLPQEVTLAPNKSGTIDVTLPIDFGPIDDFDIPPENLAVASPELKAAAAANRTTNYKYSVEVSYKTADGVEQTVNQPIRLTQPDEVRLG